SNDVSVRIGLVKKIARAFGDRNARNVMVVEMFPGSLILGWFNLSLVKSDCPMEKLR
ncbi:hypothetical protein HELRODRAFT_128674, partial [Helobdella robusta]|uniref:Peptidase S72 domain-containing protein n=1 Tax=Helobdella robusta TaxID=6412 RepID=T1EHQ0_HELRO